jgi:two-component system chemotaxis response regulator CheB
VIRVVVVDDSAFMRKAISSMLEHDPEIEVVGCARDGREGLTLIRSLDPDVVTMDLEMPVMDGLTALKCIMMEMPRPVIVVSSLTEDGARETLKALEIGAVDYLPKKVSKGSFEIVKIEDDLRAKVRAVARRKIVFPLRPKPPVCASVLARPAAVAGARSVVAIGVSTGGPSALQSLLPQLPGDYPACILIAQHMPRAFTGPFARRLDALSPLRVCEAEDGHPIAPGTVLVAPGGTHLRVRRGLTGLVAEVGDEPLQSLFKPSVNELFGSVADLIGHMAVGVVLTGMGSDGLDGAHRLKAAGGRLLAQSDSSCVVYGMPKAVVEAGLADAVVDLGDMPEALLSEVGCQALLAAEVGERR